MVREGAVQFEVERDDGEGEVAEDGGDGVAAHAVAGVDDDLERADAAHVDQRAEVRGVVGEGVAAAEGAGGGGGGGGRGGVVQPALDEGADVGEAGVLADGGGSGAAELDAVVLRRVVRGGEHRAGQVEGAGGVVELVGGAEADLDHVEALLGGAPGEGVREARRGGAHVVADDDRPAALEDGGDLGEGGAEEGGEVLVPLVGHDSAHVVRLDDL